VKAFVAYAAPLVSFIAALTALLGPSRRSDQIGIASLTGFGWAAAAFAVIGLAFTLYNANIQQKALGKAEEQLRKMRRVAQGEFQDGMQLILDTLIFAALMPYTTDISPGSAGPLPYQKFSEVDLRSQRTLDDLSQLRLSPC
jgi:hypothetical protein